MDDDSNLDIFCRNSLMEKEIAHIDQKAQVTRSKIVSVKSLLTEIQQAHKSAVEYLERNR